MNRANEENQPLVNINISDVVGLSKPIVALIERIFDAIGVMYEPHKIRKKADADAYAIVVLEEADIKISELQQRAMQRLAYEEDRKQENIENIIGKSIEYIKENAESEKIDNDLLIYFFEKAKIVSDKQMQDLWARILAGEANKVGSFSKRTLELVSTLEKSDAELFAKVLQCTVQTADEHLLLIYDIDTNIIKEWGFNFGDLSHLGTIGLIDMNTTGGFKNNKMPDVFSLGYHSHTIRLNLPKQAGNTIKMGHCNLTKTGQELASICKIEKSQGFLEYVMNKWNQLGYNPEMDKLKTCNKI